MKTIKTEDYLIQYDIKDEKLIITEIIFNRYKLKSNILIPGEIDGYPLLEFDVRVIKSNHTMEDLNNENKKTHFLILPDCIEILYGSTCDIDYFDNDHSMAFNRSSTLIDNKICPKNLKYDYYGQFRTKKPEHLLYSTSCYECNDEVLPIEFFYDFKTQEKYLNYFNKYPLHNIIKKSLYHHFEIHQYETKNDRYEYYIINNHQVIISNAEPKNEDNYYLNIPNYIIHNDKKYEVYGLGVNSISSPLYEIIILPAYLEFISIGAISTVNRYNHVAVYLKHPIVELPKFFLMHRYHFFLSRQIDHLYISDENYLSTINIAYENPNFTYTLSKRVEYNDKCTINLTHVDYIDEEYISDELDRCYENNTYDISFFEEF